MPGEAEQAVVLEQRRFIGVGLGEGGEEILGVGG
jgi:hypothetical protein